MSRGQHAPWGRQHGDLHARTHGSVTEHISPVERLWLYEPAGRAHRGDEGLDEAQPCVPDRLVGARGEALIAAVLPHPR